MDAGLKLLDVTCICLVVEKKWSITWLGTKLSLERI